MKKLLFITLILCFNFLHAEENKINLFELYKELHANPELSYQEFETSEKLALILENIGYEVTRNIGGNGVVALLQNGEGKTVMLRAGYGWFACGRKNRRYLCQHKEIS